MIILILAKLPRIDLRGLVPKELLWCGVARTSDGATGAPHVKQQH